MFAPGGAGEKYRHMHLIALSRDAVPRTPVVIHRGSHFIHAMWAVGNFGHTILQNAGAVLSAVMNVNPLAMTLNITTLLVNDCRVTCNAWTLGHGHTPSVHI